MTNSLIEPVLEDDRFIALLVTFIFLLNEPPVAAQEERLAS